MDNKKIKWTVRVSHEPTEVWRGTTVTENVYDFTFKVPVDSSTALDEITARYISKGRNITKAEILC